MGVPQTGTYEIYLSLKFTSGGWFGQAGVFWKWSRQLDLLERTTVQQRSSSIQSEIQPKVVGQQPMVVNPVCAKTGKYWILAVDTVDC